MDSVIYSRGSASDLRDPSSKADIRGKLVDFVKRKKGESVNNSMDDGIDDVMTSESAQVLMRGKSSGARPVHRIQSDRCVLFNLLFYVCFPMASALLL